MQQVTEDHTVYNELIKRGKLTARADREGPAEERHHARRGRLRARRGRHARHRAASPGDTLVLASDGLHGYLETPDELREPLALEGDEGVKALIALANDRGGKDNITAVVVKRRRGGRDRRGARQAPGPQARRPGEHAAVRAPHRARAAARDAGGRGARRTRTARSSSSEGDKGDELFIVLEGKVRVIARRRRRSRASAQGEHVGEMALIRSVPRSATVSAEAGGAELIAIRRADFFEILRKEHEVAVKMLWQFLGVLADRLDRTNSRAAQREARARGRGRDRRDLPRRRRRLALRQPERPLMTLALAAPRSLPWRRSRPLSGSRATPGRRRSRRARGRRRPRRRPQRRASPRARPPARPLIRRPRAVPPP